MSLVTVEEVLSFVESDRIPSAIQLLIDDAESVVLRRYGPNADDGVTITYERQDFSLPHPRIIWIDRPAVTVLEVHEFSGATDLQLNADDTRLLYGGGAIERISSGTNPQNAWADVVTVEYTPFDDTPQRKRVIVQLVQVALRYDGGVRSQSIGDVSESLAGYDDEREAILSQLSPALAIA